MPLDCEEIQVNLQIDENGLERLIEWVSDLLVHERLRELEEDNDSN